MKRKITTFLLALLAMVPALADDLSLGYCDGQQVDASVGSATAVAALFPADEFCMYQGASIIGVRVGVAADCAKGVTLFVRSGLLADNAFTFKTPALYAGWNDVYFDKPYTYPATSLCVGYEVATGVKPGVSGTTTANSCWALKDNLWQNLAATGTAPLCVELLIDGGSYAHTDVALLSVDSVTTALGAPFTFTGRVRNNTPDVLTTLRMSYDLGNGPVEADAQVADVLPGESGQFALPVGGASAIGDFRIPLTALSVGGRADEYAFNNTLRAPLRVLGEMVRRKVLVEEFTGQQCSNCPAGRTKIEEGLKDEDHYVMIAHHTGFGSDALTAPGTTKLNWFYNSSTTFAPGLMIDRKDLSAYGVSSNGNTHPTPVFVVPQAALVKAIYQWESAQAAPVSIDLKRSYDASTRQLTVQVGMRQVEGLAVGSNPALTLCIIENNIVAFQYPEGDNYVHQKANRAFLTQVMGDPVSLSTDQTTHATYTTTLDASWKPENMEIVAFVGNYDATNCTNCTVYNAEGCALEGNDVVDGIGTPTVASSATIQAIYDLQGARLDALRRGVNIVKFNNGSVRKIIMK